MKQVTPLSTNRERDFAAHVKLAQISYSKECSFRRPYCAVLPILPHAILLELPPRRRSYALAPVVHHSGCDEGDDIDVVFLVAGRKSNWMAASTRKRGTICK